MDSNQEFDTHNPQLDHRFEKPRGYKNTSSSEMTPSTSNKSTTLVRSDTGSTYCTIS